MTPDTPPDLTAAINALLHPFRKLPGEPAMSESREDWRARRHITGQLSAMGLTIEHVLDRLHWASRNPLDSEEAARVPLERLHTQLCELFRTSPSP